MGCTFHLPHFLTKGAWQTPGKKKGEQIPAFAVAAMRMQREREWEAGVRTAFPALNGALASCVR